MRNQVEFLTFTLVAAAILWGGFVLHPSDPGSASSGDGGAQLSSLEASSASIAAMVAEWERPPESQQAVAGDLSEPAFAEPPVAPVPHGVDGPAPAAAQSLPEPPQPSQPPDPAAARPPPPPAPEPAARRVDKPRPAAPDSAAQRAAGSGGGASAGAARQGTATLSKARRDDLMASWGSAIRARIERRKRAPRGGGSGTVMLRLAVSSNGELAGVSVIRSSGQPALDESALRAVTSARFPKAPSGLPRGAHAFTLPVTFR